MSVLAISAPLPAASARPLPPVPALDDLAEVFAAPSADNPVVAVLPGGIRATRADLLDWFDQAGGLRRDLEAADHAGRTEILCAFVDDLDLGLEHLVRSRARGADIDRPDIWRATLARAAYRDLVSAPDVGGKPADLVVLVTRFQSIMAVVGPRPADLPSDRFAADPRLEAALLAYAVQRGLASRPAVVRGYRRAMLRDLASAGRDIAMVEAATFFGTHPEAEIGTRPTRSAGRRAACWPVMGAPLTFEAARRANADEPFLRRATSLAVRRRSRSKIVQGFISTRRSSD